MFVECVIANFFTCVKTSLPEFEYLPEEVWSPSTDFMDRLASYIVDKDVASKLEAKKWIGFCWSINSPISQATNLANPMTLAQKDILNKTGVKYDYSGKHVTFDVAAFSNDPYYSVKFMEMFSVIIERSITYDVLYPAPLKAVGLIPTQALIGNSGNEPSYDRDKTGSLSKFTFSLDVDFPVVRAQPQKKLIGRVQDPLIPIDPNNPPDPLGANAFHSTILVNKNIPQSFIDNLNPSFVIL